MTLEDNVVYIYDKDVTDLGCVDHMELCPANGTVSVHSAVTAAELTNTASSDLPYILRLEFVPNTTCWPGRYALSFSLMLNSLDLDMDHSDMWSYL